MRLRRHSDSTRASPPPKKKRMKKKDPKRDIYESHMELGTIQTYMGPRYLSTNLIFWKGSYFEILLDGIHNWRFPFLMFLLSGMGLCELMHTCHMYASCTNTPSGFECNCNDGFAGDGMFCEGNVLLQRKLNCRNQDLRRFSKRVED